MFISCALLRGFCLCGPVLSLACVLQRLSCDTMCALALTFRPLHGRFFPLHKSDLYIFLPVSVVSLSAFRFFCVRSRDLLRTCHVPLYIVAIVPASSADQPNGSWNGGLLGDSSLLYFVAKTVMCGYFHVHALGCVCVDNHTKFSGSVCAIFQRTTA